METQQSSIAMESSAAQPPPQPTPAPTAAATPPPVQTPPPVETPKPRPSEAPKPTPLPEPEATPDLSKFAMLTSTPPPALRDPEDAESPPPEVGPTAPPIVSRPMPERPATAYQPEKQQTRMTGRITDRGPSSVNAVGTPLGKYQKQVSDAIGSRWYYYMKSKIDLVSIGTAHVEAEVDAQGKVQKLRVVSNNANEAFANVCLQSFQEAQIPPIPPDVVAALPGGRLPVDIYFTTYANQ
jgi:outer membrane biosynthesis protein TonB